VLLGYYAIIEYQCWREAFVSQPYNKPCFVGQNVGQLRQKDSEKDKNRNVCTHKKLKVTKNEDKKREKLRWGLTGNGDH